MRLSVPETASLHVVDAHINAPAFSHAALSVFDDWIARGIVSPAEVRSAIADARAAQ